MKKTETGEHTMFNLQADDMVTVHHRDADSPKFERVRVTEVFEGEHRHGSRDFGFMAFDVDAGGFTQMVVMDLNTFVTKHKS